MTNRGDDTGAKPRRHGIITGAVGLIALAIVTALLTNWFSKPSSVPQVPTTNFAAVTPSPEVVSPAAPPQPVAQIPAPIPPAAATPELSSAQPGVAVQLPPPSAPMQPAPQLQAGPPATQTIPPQQQLAVLPPPQVQPPSQAQADQPTWLKFATPSVATGDRPRIAIIIDDLGLDRPRTARAINLPSAVTMSFIAYSGDLPRQTAAARANGHELLVHVPMEPINVRQDMGPNGLAVNQPRDEVLRRLRWDLDRFDGYVGINNHMGSRFTGDSEAMDWVIGELKSRGLLFMDSRTIAATTGEKVAAAQGVPYVSRDVFLDDEQSVGAVRDRLSELETLAKRRGNAVAIGHPHDVTLDALTAWIATLPQKGLVLVPLTDIVKLRARS